MIVGPVLVAVSVAAAAGAIALSPILTALAAVVGAILTVTALTRKCPLNSLLGLDTAGGRAPTEEVVEDETVERLA